MPTQVSPEHLCHADGTVAATLMAKPPPPRGAPLAPRTRHHSGQSSGITMLQLLGHNVKTLQHNSILDALDPDSLLQVGQPRADAHLFIK